MIYILYKYNGNYYYYQMKIPSAMLILTIVKIIKLQVKKNQLQLNNGEF